MSGNLPPGAGEGPPVGDREEPEGLSCPLPVRERREVLIAHGGGGRLSAELIENVLLPELPPAPSLEELHDGAVLDAGSGRLCLTTDSFVVRPLFFPGGDIGSLAVHGTVNDIAMCGGVPRYLSLALILEEGFALEDLRRIVRSAGQAARACGVSVVTGDTKVVERGKGDGVYINTTGLGVVPEGARISPRRVREGDAVILSGPVGLHGMAVMGSREGLEFSSAIRSDSAPLHEVVAAVLEACPETHCLRDPTRGGVATSLVEIARAAGVGFRIFTEEIPVPGEVQALCELLGFDPLYVANEGKCLVICDAAAAPRVLEAMRRFAVAREARVIGRAERTPGGCVVAEGALGGKRVLDLLSGEQLPRIC